MNSAAIHSLAVYGICLAALVTVIVTRRRAGGPGIDPVSQLSQLWPFIALALVESLTLSGAGHLTAEWFLPCLTMFAVVAISRSPSVVRRTRTVLTVAAIVLWMHGTYLMGNGYATRPKVLPPGARVESDWYTPLCGLRRVVR